MHTQTLDNPQLSNSEAQLDALAREFCEIREILKMADAKKKELQKQILEITGEGTEQMAGEFKISHKIFTQKRKVPIVYEEKEIEATRFDVKYIGRLN